MRKLKLFFACLLMAVLSIGQVWGATVPFAWTGSQNATTKDITWTSTDICTMVQEQNGAQTAPSGSYISAPRWYSGNKITITAGSGVSTFTSIVITATSESYATALANSTYTRTGGTGSVSASASGTAVTITCTGTVTAFTIVMGGQSRLSGTTTPTINYTAAGSSCTKNVTISKGTPSHGDFTLSKDGAQATCDAAVTVVVDPTPAEHYKATGVTAPNSSSISAPDEDGKYTVTYAQNTNAASEINVNFTLKDQHTVTWNNHGLTSTSQVYDGEKPVFPTPNPTSCDATSTTFIGWATAAWDGKLANTDGKTVYTSASAMPDVTGAVTYYAVYAKATAGTPVPHDGPSWDRASNTVHYTDGYTFSASANAPSNKNYYQDASSGTGNIKLYHNTTAIFASTPNTVLLTASIGGGTGGKDLADAVYAQLLDKDGNAIGHPTEITSHITTATGDDYEEVELDLTDITSAYGVMLYHEKESGYNVRFYSFSLSYTTGGTTYSDYMTTCSCEDLGTPVVTVPAANLTYNSAKLTWPAVDHAAKYLVKFNGVDQEPTTNLYFDATGLTAETQYTYQVKALAADAQDNFCDGAFSAVANFTTEPAPTAKLYLVQLKGQSPAEEGTHTVGVEFDLPTSAATCSKTLVGWTTVTYKDYTHATDAPAVLLKKYTFTSDEDVTLYAVYAEPEMATSWVDTELGDLTTSDVFVLGSSEYAIPNNASAAPAVQAITVSTGKITSSVTDNLKWKVSGNATDGYSFSPNGSSTTWLYCSTTADTKNNDNIRVGSGNRKVWELDSYGYLVTKDSYVARYLSIYVNNDSEAQDFRGYINTTNGAFEAKFYKKTQTISSYSNYSTTCIDAPEAIVDPEEVNATAAGVAAGVIEADYDHVDEENISVALYNDIDCSESFEGTWLTASINGDNNIAYTIAENTSYNDGRTAYIKLTAPETSGAASPAVVVIPVTQAKKAAEFASLQELVAADVNANTEVTVSFSDVVIKEMYEYNDNVCGVVFNIQKAGQDIKIYFNSQTTISGWVAGGKLSGTLTNCPWKTFSGAWQLAPKSGWAWANLTYEEPAVVSSVAVSGTPTKTTYNTGEAFDPVGLTVTVTYSNALVETITANDANWAYVSWSKDPATFAAEHVGTNKSVSVTATYNAVPSSATEISGLTINKIAVSSVSLNKNAATLKTGKTLTLTATVAPENATYKTVSWKSDDTDIATVNEDGVVTAVAAGTTTITATSTDDNTKTATCELTIIESVNFNKGVWKLVTNKDELTAGSYVIFAAAGDDVAMKSYDTGNNCRGKSATKSDFLTYDNEFGVFEIGDYEISTVTYKTFQDENTNQYLFLSSNNNYLKAQDDKDETVAWTITNVSNEGVTVVTSKSQSTRTIRYNANTANPGNPLFACYTTGQADIALYKFYIKVTFDANEGSAVDPVYVEYNESVAAPENPTKAGYRFNGWKLNSAAYDFNTKLTENITLEADWSQLYTVTYAAGEGSGDAPDAVQKVAGEAFNLAANTFTAPAGKEFDGWLCDIDAAKYAAGAEYTMTAAATTFTAQWKQITYAVTYVSAHGTAPDAENAASVTLAELTEAGWTHTGWVANVDVEVDDATVTAGTPIANGKVVVLSAATEFTAQWIEDAPTPVYTEVRDELTIGWYYTMCLNKAVTAVQGGTIWRVLSKAANGTDVILEEVTGTLDAGRPYIFQATASTLEVAYTGDAVGAPVNDDDNNGLTGSFEQVKIAQAATNYIIWNNALYYVNSNNVYVGANRAYLDMTGVPAYSTSSNAPRRRVTMSVYGEQTATGIGNVQGDDVQCTKVLIDGQMYILRGEKMYNVNGQVVK